MGAPTLGPLIGKAWGACGGVSFLSRLMPEGRQLCQELFPQECHLGHTTPAALLGRVAFQAPSQGPDMTTTSLQSRQGGYLDAFRHADDACSLGAFDGAGAPQELPTGAAASGYAAQARRMKAFAGQRQFQAPVADDFARGMLAPGQASGTAASPLKHIASALAALIAGLGWLKSG